MDDQIANEILNEISECREDERNSQNQVVQIISTAGTVLGVILGASIFGEDSIVSKDALFLLSNVVFCTACSYIVTLGVGNVLRYHYIQKLEDQLALLYCSNDIEKIGLVQWMSFTSPIMTRNPLHVRSKYAILHYFSYTLSVVATIIFSVGVTFFLYYKLNQHTIIDRISIVFLGVVFAVCLLSYIIICFNGKQISEKIYRVSLNKKKTRLKQKSEVERKNKREEKNKGKKKNKREEKNEIVKVLMYFIYPKNKDLQKMFLIILGFLLGIILIEGYICVDKMKENFDLLILSIVAIDFLLYQARYQWNDIRGIEEDKSKSDRLPVDILGEKNAIIISLIVICIRLSVLTCILYHIIDNDSIFISLCLDVVLVLLLAVLYEFVRSKKWKFGTFFLVSLGYPLRIFIGICAVYPVYAKKILIFLFNLLLGLLKRCNLLSLTVDRTQHFSSSLLIAFMSAYAFMGFFSVIIPWLYEAIEGKRKSEKIDKRHYEYLLSKVETRYQEYIVKGRGNASTLICSKGKISDMWNWTYIVSISIFSGLVIIDCYHFRNDNILSILFSEILFVVSGIFICIFPNTKKKQNIFLILLIFVLLFKSFLCCANFGIVIYYILIYCNQAIISLIYWFLRYHFQDDFNFFRECKKILLQLFILIIGKDAWKYLCK